MSSATTPDVADRPGYPVADLRRAVEIYLALAYPDDDVPEAVRRRLGWQDAPAECLSDALHGYRKRLLGDAVDDFCKRYPAP